jgi:hypothetical protein
VIRPAADDGGWIVADGWVPTGPEAAREFTVTWQFAPGAILVQASATAFRLKRENIEVRIEVDPGWAKVELIERGVVHPGASRSAVFPLAGSVSSAFRRVEHGPFLRLTARSGEKPCVFTTAFLASPHS